MRTRCGWRLLALLAKFAHDLRDVNIGGHLGLLLLLQLPEDDGAETGPSLLGIVPQLGLTGRERRRRERETSEGFFRGDAGDTNSSRVKAENN